MKEKLKILTLGDHPISPSGVGIQTRYMIEGLIKTGKYEFVSLGGAIKHNDYAPVRVEGYEENWVVLPVDGYGTQEMVRSVLRNEKPDILWLMTDPRFWGWLWHMEHEIRPLVPMVYYHVWDNYPYPKYNKQFYDSNDVVVTISKLTDDIVRNVSPDVECKYLPHSVNNELFKIIDETTVKSFRDSSFPAEKNPDRTMFFFNSRNARRKQSGSMLWWYKEFLDIVGHDNACLLMHTDPKDPHGQDLELMIKELGLINGQALISRQKVDTEYLALMYNMCDCTIAISDAEGFGLSVNESLSCGTPVIATMTGGLQEQVTDGKEFFGVGIEPASKAVIGSQEVPYIYEDRISKESYIDALLKIHNMSKEKRKELGRKGRDHILKNYNCENYIKQWDETFTEVYEKYGSWDTRKNYKAWRLLEVS